MALLLVLAVSRLVLSSPLPWRPLFGALVLRTPLRVSDTRIFA